MGVRRRHRDVDFRRRLVIDRNAVLQLQHIAEIGLDNLEPVVADGDRHRVPIGVYNRENSGAVAGGVLGEPDPVRVSEARHAIGRAADDFVHIACVRARPRQPQGLIAAVFEIPHFNVMGTRFKIKSHRARARRMQPVIIEHRDAVDKQHAAVIACQIERISAAVADHQLAFVFRGEVISRCAVPEALLSLHIVEAVNDAFRVRRRIEVDLIEIAESAADIVIGRLEPLAARKRDLRRRIRVIDSDNHIHRIGGAARIRHRNGDVNRRFGLIIDADAVFEFQHERSAVFHHFKPVVAHKEGMKIACVRVGDRELGNDRAGGVVGNGKIVRPGPVFKCVAADHLPDAAGVRPGPGELQCLAAAVFEVTHFDIVGPGIEIDGDGARLRPVQSVIVEHSDAVDEQHAAIVARHIEGVGSAFADDEIAFVFCGEIIRRTAVPEALLPLHVVEAVDDAFCVRRGAEIDLVEIAERAADIVIRRFKACARNKAQRRPFVGVRNIDRKGLLVRESASVCGRNHNIHRSGGLEVESDARL